jgi:hypothetical protein
MDIDADFAFVEKKCKKSPKKSYRLKTFALGNKSKTSIFLSLFH